MQPRDAPAAAAAISGLVIAIFVAWSGSVFWVVVLGLLGLLLLVMTAAQPPGRDAWLGAGFGLAVVAVAGAHFTATMAVVPVHGPPWAPDPRLERVFLPLVVVATTLGARRLLAAADRSRISPRAALATALGLSLVVGATCARTDARAFEVTDAVSTDAVTLPDPCDGRVDVGGGLVLDCWTRTEGMYRSYTSVALLPQRARDAGVLMPGHAPLVAQRLGGHVIVGSVQLGRLHSAVAFGMSSGPSWRFLSSDLVEVPQIPSRFALLLSFGLVSLCIGGVLAARAVRRSQRLDRAVVARRGPGESGFTLADGTPARLDRDPGDDVVLVELAKATEGYRVPAVISATVIDRGEPHIVRAALRARMFRLAFAVVTSAILFFGPLAALRAAGWAFSN